MPASRCWSIRRTPSRRSTSVPSRRCATARTTARSRCSSGRRRLARPTRSRSTTSAAPTRPSAVDDDAIAALSASVRLRPDYHVARIRLAALLEERGDRERAVLHYARALEDAQKQGRWLDAGHDAGVVQALVERGVVGRAHASAGGVVRAARHAGREVRSRRARHASSRACGSTCASRRPSIPIRASRRRFCTCRACPRRRISIASCFRGSTSSRRSTDAHPTRIAGPSCLGRRARARLSRPTSSSSRTCAAMPVRSAGTATTSIVTASAATTTARAVPARGCHRCAAAVDRARARPRGPVSRCSRPARTCCRTRVSPIRASSVTCR